jgi:DNA-binding CsgD family transcriptional regulator
MVTDFEHAGVSGFVIRHTLGPRINLYAIWSRPAAFLDGSALINMVAMQNELLARIYEAAAIPELWRGVMAEFARLAGAKEAVLIVSRGPEFLKWLSSSEGFQNFPGEHIACEGGPERTRRLLARQHAGFLTDHDVFTPEELTLSPLFRDFLIPRGYGIGVATAIPVPSGDTVIIHAEGEHARGPASRETIARLDQLRPHFARAALLSARLELERAHAAAQALKVLGLPGAVLGRGGRTLAANELLTAMMPDVVQDRPSRLALANPTADVLLADAIAQAEAIIGATVGSIPIPASEERPPMIVHVLPIRGVAHDVFGNAVAMIIVTPVVPREVPTANVIQGLFDLTPAEARLAEVVASGSQPREAAASLGIAEETARTTLKRVFAKTGVGRQADLVALLNGAQVPFRR